MPQINPPPSPPLFPLPLPPSDHIKATLRQPPQPQPQPHQRVSRENKLNFKSRKSSPKLFDSPNILTLPICVALESGGEEETTPCWCWQGCKLGNLMGHIGRSQLRWREMGRMAFLSLISTIDGVFCQHQIYFGPIKSFLSIRVWRGNERENPENV